MAGPPSIHEAHLWPFQVGPKIKDRKEKRKEYVCFLRLTRWNWTWERVNFIKLRRKTLLLKAFCFPNKKDRTSHAVHVGGKPRRYPACLHVVGCALTPPCYPLLACMGRFVAISCVVGQSSRFLSSQTNNELRLSKKFKRVTMGWY